MNRWIEKSEKLLAGDIGSLVVPGSYDANDVPGDDAVEKEEVWSKLQVEESAGFETEVNSRENDDAEI